MRFSTTFIREFSLSVCPIKSCVFVWNEAAIIIISRDDTNDIANVCVCVCETYSNAKRLSSVRELSMHIYAHQQPPTDQAQWKY